LARLAETQHQQVTNAVTRVLVGQASITVNYRKVKWNKTEHMARALVHYVHTQLVRGFAKLHYIEGGRGFAVSAFLFTSEL